MNTYAQPSIQGKRQIYKKIKKFVVHEITMIAAITSSDSLGMSGENSHPESVRHS